MTHSKIAILDVGHGNCCVLIDERGTAVFDTGPGGTLINYLQENGVQEVKCVLISHADKDHIAGLIGLLSSGDFSVSQIYLNPDAPRQTKLWDDLRCVLKASGSKIIHGLSTSVPGKLNMGRIEIQVLAPSPELAVSGVGGKTLSGKPITAHSLNAVIRLVHGARPLVILLGDLDEIGLRELTESGAEIRAEVAVFPHHGGLPGSDPVGVTRTLCQNIRPRVAIFSIGRGKYSTPRPEILNTLRDALPNVHIACTQLSTLCSAEIPKSESKHWVAVAAQGRESKKCCLGTFVITIAEKVSMRPSLSAHSKFINIQAPTPLCRG